jgi:poly(A) polymerase
MIGGSVRDLVIGRESKDIDLIVNKIDFSKLVDILVKYGRIIFDKAPKDKKNIGELPSEEREKLIRENFGVVKFIPHNTKLKEAIDIALPRTDDYAKAGQSGIRGIKTDVVAQADPNLSIYSDIERRDFTINSISLNIIDGKIIDPFDGVEDIIRHKIKAVGDPKERILKEDFSRAFRAIRFACVLNAEIDPATFKVVKEIFEPAEQSSEEIYKDQPEILRKVQQLERKIRRDFQIPEGQNLPKFLQVYYNRTKDNAGTAVALETISIELIKAMKGDIFKLIKLLEEVEGLKILLPEIAAMKNCPQPKEFHSEGDVMKHTMMLLKNLPKNASPELIMAGFLHDIGKPATIQTPEKDGVDRIRFNKHAQVGAEMAKKICDRFRLDSEFTNKVTWLVEKHMFPLGTEGVELKSTTLEKYFFNNPEWGEDLLKLSYADGMASIPPDGKLVMSFYNKLVKRIEDLKVKKEEKEKLPQPLLNGKNLIGLGLKPGPFFSKILDAVREEQLNGVVKTKEEAIELARKITSEKEKINV